MTAGVETHGAFRCCGVRVDAVTMDDAVSFLQAFAATGGGRAVHLCNAWTLALARRDPILAEALNRGDLNLPDGTPLTWIGRHVGFSHMTKRVYGPLGLRHYLYGSTPNVAADLARRLDQLAPGAEVIGIESPPFRPLTDSEEQELVERVHLAQPDVVWVGLGTPRQDIFVDHFRNRLSLTLVADGAAFGFLAGAKRQAPVWMQDRGLEWAFRLATEATRLWKRYLLGNAGFLLGTAHGVEVTSARPHR
jgi:N-acetylglucosaminyldiphosphoundecaprenol N-acetyl-beta-D-mannosaminyltransferase